MRHPLVRLARPGNAVLAGVGVVAGWLLAGGPLPGITPGPAPADLAPVLLRLAAAAVTAIAFAAAGNARNDVTDVEVDRRAHPERPLVRGDVTLRQARGLVLALYGVSAAAGALVGWGALLLVAAGLLLMEGYERALKRRGLPGNLAIGALTAAPFLLGAAAHAHTRGDWASLDLGWGPAVLALALLAALATTGREVLKDVEDEAADRGHRRTLPMRLGARPASLVAAALLALAVLLSPLPWALESVLAWPYLAVVGLADACFLAAAFAGVRAPSRGQRLAKAGMVAALAAIVVGVAAGGRA